MTQDSFKAIVALLTPYMSNGDKREAIVQTALFGCPVLQQINWSGAANTFVVHLVQTLRRYGECETGKPALVTLLQAIKEEMGLDKQATIDSLVAQLNEDSQEDASVAPNGRRRVALKFPIHYAEFDPDKLLVLIAGLVEIGVDDISIVYLAEGSVLATVELPALAAKRLINRIVASPEAFDSFGGVSVIPLTEDKADTNYDLEVYVLGSSSVLYQGSQIEAWRGQLPFLLFHYILDTPFVSRSEICDTFWPELDISQAINVFQVTRYRLQQAFGFEVLIHSDHHYQINPNLKVYYDVTDFIETLMRGRDPNNPTPFVAWEKAINLYRGPFLPRYNSAWIEERRVALRSGYVHALTQMATIWISKDRKELALKLYRQALDEDFSREELHQEIMRLYTELGRRSEAVSHYQAMQKSFIEVGLTISAETEKVFNDILSS